MPRITLLTIFLFSLSFSFAQEWDWREPFGDDWSHNFSGFEVDSEGNTYVTGGFTDYLTLADTIIAPLYGTPGTLVGTNRGNNYYLAKFNRDKELEWVKTHGQDSALNAHAQGRNHLFLDKDDNVYTIFQLYQRQPYTLNGQDYANADSARKVVIKYSPDGDILWHKETNIGWFYDGAANNDHLFLSVQYFEDEFKWGGNSLLDLSSTSYDLILKIDLHTGDFIDLLSFQEDPSYISFESIANTSEGNILISGSMYGHVSNQYLDYNTDRATAYIWLTDENFDTKLFKAFDQELPMRSYLHDAVMNEQDSVIAVAGEYYTYQSSTDSTISSFSFGQDTIDVNYDEGTEGFVGLLDWEGNPLWMRTLKGSSGERIEHVSFNDDGYIVAAGMKSDQATFMDTTFAQIGADWITDIFMTKLNLDGEYSWVHFAGNVKRDFLIAAETYNDEVYFAGWADFQSYVFFGHPADRSVLMPADGTLGQYDIREQMNWFARLQDCNTSIDTIGSDLYIPEGASYDWYQNDTFLETETSGYYTPETSGDYWAWVTYQDGCKVRTHSVPVDRGEITSAFTAEENAFRIFPNPTKNMITINGLKGNSNIQVLNLQGELLLETQLSSATKDVDLSGLSQGAFLIVVENQGLQSSQLLIKQ